MRITHVIRGDDHVNNTPRQINILRALGGELPVYAHLPTVLNEQGEKMSKRHGAMSVMGYRDARLSCRKRCSTIWRAWAGPWRRGDLLARAVRRVVRSGASGQVAGAVRPEKLNWLNNHYIKEADNERLAGLAKPFFAELGIDEAALAQGADLAGCAGAAEGPRNDGEGNRRERRDVLSHSRQPDAESLAQHVTDAVRPALADLAAALQDGRVDARKRSPPR